MTDDRATLPYDEGSTILTAADVKKRDRYFAIHSIPGFAIVVKNGTTKSYRSVNESHHVPDAMFSS